MEKWLKQGLEKSSLVKETDRIKNKINPSYRDYSLFDKYFILLGLSNSSPRHWYSSTSKGKDIRIFSLEKIKNQKDVAYRLVVGPFFYSD